MPALVEDWVLRLDEGFSLTDRKLDPVLIPSRKAQELLVLLATIKPGFALRDTLAEQLWPTASFSLRRVNFRKALSLLRKQIGAEKIVSDRARCGLNPDFPFQFEQADGDETSANLSSAAEGFLKFVEWQAETSPAQFLESLRSNVSFALNIPPLRIRRALRKACSGSSARPPGIAWSEFWDGHGVALASGVRAAIPILKRSTLSAIVLEDTVLIRESAYLWAICRILAGNPGAAIQILNRAEAVIHRTHPKGASQFLDVRASALIHLGNHREGNELLATASRQDLCPVECAKREALQALYTATGGSKYLAEAKQINEAPTRLSQQSGTLGVEVVCRLTSGVIDATEEPTRAVEILTKLDSDCQLHHFSHISLYALETLAIAHRNLGAHEESAAAWQAAVKARSRLGFAYTAWDRARLAPHFAREIAACTASTLRS